MPQPRSTAFQSHQKGKIGPNKDNTNATFESKDAIRKRDDDKYTFVGRGRDGGGGGGGDGTFCLPSEKKLILKGKDLPCVRTIVFS